MSSDVDLYEYLEQAVLILFVLGGIALVLCNLVLGGSSVSSTSSRSRKYGPLQDSLDIGSDAKEQPSPTTETLLRRVTGKGRERRTSVRRKGNPVGVVVLAGEAAKAEPGLVINRSKGGLCLSLPGPVAAGTILQVRACQAPEDIPWIRVLVRHCVAKGDRWNLGCQFTEELPWSVLLLFG
jgi:hypothetical protein